MKSSGENWRGKDGASSPDTPQAKSSRTDRTHSCPDAPALDKGGCRNLCPRGTRPRRRATRPAASSALPCSPAPPVSRHQSLSVQSGRRPPARRRHFQFFPGCTRTTHNTNKPQAAPAPASLPPPPASHPRRACARPAPTPAGLASIGARASAHCAHHPMGREEPLGGTGRGGEKSGASPAGRFDWLSIPAETAAPSLGTPAPPAITTAKPKRVGLLIVRLELPGPGCAEDGKH